MNRLKVSGNKNEKAISLKNVLEDLNLKGKNIEKKERGRWRLKQTSKIFRGRENYEKREKKKKFKIKR